MMISGVSVSHSDSNAIGWQDPEHHDRYQEEMNPDEADGPIVYQLRTESRGDVPVLETSNQSFIEHQDRISDLVTTGQWDKLEQYGSLTEEAEAIMTNHNVKTFIEEEFPE